MKNQDRVCVVTGGTSGVGRAIAVGVARTGSTLVIPGRDRERTNAVVQEIRRKTGNAHVYGMEADLASQESIRRFSEEFRSKYGRLDVLSCNAAILSMRREETVDGLERTLAVNYLSHFLLVHLLRDLLVTAAPSRVVLVSGTPSVIQRLRIRWDDPQYRKDYRALGATLHAAAAKVMFTLELARRAEGSGLVAHTFHPGIVRSALGRGLPGLIRPFYRLANALIPRGCPTGVLLATDPRVDDHTGGFYARRHPVPFVFAHHQEGDGKRLWDLSADLLGVS